MNWFSGSIPDAIAEVKSRQKILLVFVVGEDELSNNMTVTYNDPAVAEKLSSHNCVALKLIVNSVPYQQFSQIYPVVVIPSSFFIGKNGLPIEIITGHLDPQAFIEKIDKIFQLSEESNGPRLAGTSEACSSSQSTSQDATEPMDSSDCPPTAVAGSGSNSGPSTSKGEAVVSSSEATLKAEPDSSQASGGSSDDVADDKVQRAKELIEARRQNKVHEEKEDSDSSSEGDSISSIPTTESGSKRLRLTEEIAKEKEEEIKRRELGKAVQQAKQTREEAEMKQWAETRAKEKEEERVARERVRAQIAQDRAERASKYQQVKAEEVAAKKEEQMARLKEEQEKAAKEAAMRSTMARLQFRLPDGSSFTNQFSADSKLEEARDYIINEIRPSFSNFTLCTTFPRRQFQASDYSQTLRDLQLAPSAAILVLPGSSQTVAISNNGGSFFGNVFWMLVSLLLAVWRAVMSVFGRGSSQGNEASRQSSPPLDAADDTTASASEPGLSGIQDSQEPSQSSAKKSNDGQDQGPRRRVYREGNVFRISSQPTDDDDNNTWNGNSTQQM